MLFLGNMLSTIRIHKGRYKNENNHKWKKQSICMRSDKSDCKGKQMIFRIKHVSLV